MEKQIENLSIQNIVEIETMPEPISTFKVKEEEKSEILNLLNEFDNLSFSNTSSIIQQDVKFDLELIISDNEGFKLQGVVEILMKPLVMTLNKIILDCNNLNIKQIIIQEISQKITSENIIYSTLDVNKNIFPDLGNPLIISIPEEIQNVISNKDLIGDCLLNVIITYSAMKGENWIFIPSKDTNEKQYPIGYILNEEIGARTCFPCQDTPLAKITFKAHLSSINPLIAFASGILKKCENHEKKSTFYYEQKIPVSTYLIVFAIGDYTKIKVNERINIFCEKSIAQRVTEDYKALNEYLVLAEKVICPYEWGEFNILVTPNFKYQGMENPNLVYIDSLKTHSRNLILHEIIHSWFGNLVTNQNWENFWLNEGITTHFECKLLKILFGDERYITKIKNQNKIIVSLISKYGEKSNRVTLYPDYQHQNPSKIYGMFPYYKGSLFMRYIEHQIGEEHILRILRELINKYKFKTIDWLMFKNHFDEQVKIISKELADLDGKTFSCKYNDINWEIWVLGSGTPLWMDT